jgi:murein DD-endopeptidase MepM/ murein hydrolase activator NlpD
MLASRLRPAILALVVAALPVLAAPGRLDVASAAPPATDRPAVATPAGAPPAAAPPAVTRPAAAAPGLWGWPLAGQPTVSRPFDAPPTPYAAGHRGVDLQAAPGDPVLSAGAGVVAFAGLVAGRPVVSVQHADGLRTTYEPVQPLVAAGQQVTRGAPLGVLVGGHAGCPATACLHWGLRRGETYLDPLLLLRPPRVRLLPWG